ncbi:DUF429 domain-containing protein [Nocardioides sp. LHG3406-4]|uniref:DUF429 domain-containing protein n=1 Tax=Nocardioides sp. LHG3406-4 TaxID=2804575 RepID=UPI003CF7F313
MYFVGLDLAWGEKKPSGLAVVDARGHLVHIDLVRTDEEIVAGLASYATGECLVAIDAPLIVVNPTGNRPAEAQLNSDFARFDAGAHPSNTGKPEFATEPRGARVATLLGLDIDPESRSTRRAIEVYPHPATVALFELGRTLKYKQRPGRSLADLQSELLILIRLLESLATADPPLHLSDHDGWRALVAAAGEATRKSELRVVEDQIDAVVCAYVAAYAVAHPGRTTTYGDGLTGYIVTPSLPAGHRPAKRPVRLPAADRDPVTAAVSAYAQMQPGLRDAAVQAVELVTTVLDEAGINYLSVTGRAKTVASFAAKASRTVDGKPAFLDPLSDIGDLVGVRVITYVHSDVEAVVGLLADEVSVREDRDMGLETASEGRFGYASRHLQIEAGPDQHPAYPLLEGRTVQVQIRTVLQHAWAEFEHDIRYKGTIPEADRADFDRRFTLAAGLLELADREFSTIRDRLQAGASTESGADDDDPRITAQELAAFLAGQYADASWSRTDHYAWISGLLLELGITSLAELAEVVRPVDTAAIDIQLGYRHRTGAVRRLDDVLLSAYGESYIALHGNAHRVGLLTERLARMRG